MASTLFSKGPANSANPLLDAAKAVELASKQVPLADMGAMLPARQFGGLTPGWSVFEAQQAEVPVQELRWPESVRRYEDMRRDAQVQGLLQSVFLPVRHMGWFTSSKGTEKYPTMAREIAQDLGLPLDDEDAPLVNKGIDFDDFLRLGLLALAIGHQYFEESGTLDATGKYRLTRLAQRPQTQIRRIDVAPSGDLISIRTWAAQIGMPFVDIPAERLVSFVWDREGANWAGRPLLYGVHRAWQLKDELIRGDAVTHRRFGGVPYMETTQPSVVSAEAQKVGAEIMQALRSGDTSGFTTPYGQKPHLLGVEGTLPNAIISAQYHDTQMARAFMQMFAELGNSVSGSRALGLTLIDHYEQGIIAIANWCQKTIMQLVERIVERNYGPDAPVPVIGWRIDDHTDMAIAELVAAIDSGLIVVDADLEAAIRARGNLPPRNLTEPGRTPPNPANEIAVAAAAANPPPRPAPVVKPGTPPAIANTDFAALQAAHGAAVAHLTSMWVGIQAAQIADLGNQIKNATSVTALATITPAVLGGAALTAGVAGVLTHGATTAMDEAAHQGHTLPKPDLDSAHTDLATASGAVASLLAQDLGQSAASKAIALSGSGADLSPENVAAQVVDYLHGLSGATPAYEIAGLVSRAQNEGRFAAMAGAPDGTNYYSSELNDANTCTFCEHEDGTEFDSLADARRDYPAGGFVSCAGGNRCRGTVVATYPETPGQTSS